MILKGGKNMRTPKRFDNNDLPFKKFRSELDGMFQRFFEDPFFTNSSNQEPASNIIEKENHYLIEVEVPGVNPNDVEIDVEGNMLKIKGERKQSFEEGDDTSEVHKVEHSYGSFYRAFTLPDGIDDEGITATNNNGILSIELPKASNKKSRRIEINNE